MDGSPASLDKVVELARKLSTRDKARLIGVLAPDIERELPVSGPRKSLYGLCKDLGTAPSSSDIDEARREAWRGFPREDV